MVESRKNLVIYHRIDCDGICSYTVTKKYYESKGIIVDGLGWNYGDELPNVDDFIKEYSNITLVDISFPADVMLKLYESKKLVWIDHHITAINDSISHGYSDSMGIRENGTAACKLCWQFFYPKTNVPLAINFLASYDVWEKDGEYDWNDAIYPFQVGFKNEVELNPNQWNSIWGELINDEYDESEGMTYNSVVFDIVEKGKLLIDYDKKRNKPIVRKYGFEVEIDGKYKGICLLNPIFGSTTFESVLEDYDVFVVVNRVKKGCYNVSMYKEPTSGRAPEFSCGEYLKEHYEGGGHDCAAGGRLNAEQFMTLVEDSKI